MYLQDILDHKRLEIAEFKKNHTYGEFERLLPAPGGREFFLALKKGGYRLIAEVKKASPSLGVIRADFEPLAIAGAYQAGGADAISVLTDQRFFQGSMDHLQKIRTQVGLPLLRKDFILDEIQILEARAGGAAACLLIVKALPQKILETLCQFARQTGLDPLVEIHDGEELRRALDAGADIIGINNRSLETFVTDLSVSLELLPLIPESCLRISESGIRSGEDTAKLKGRGADAVLVGEALMQSSSMADLIAELKHEN